MKKRLPIGISSFEEIRTGGYYYVDKTPFVRRLLDGGKYFFLSRPRRFGKSLFVDTLKQAFLGKKDLFEGLYLYDHWDWNVTYPVVHISFGQISISDLPTLNDFILSVLRENAKKYGIHLEEKLMERQFYELIISLWQKTGRKVVVLIDEYDKPILDKIEEKETAKSIREVLKSLYSVLKDLDQHLKLVFITGVSKFSKVSLFSGLNQLQDITLHPGFAEICGYTQEELERVFAEELKDKDLDAIKCWYNGYSFCGKPLYNPFDVLLYLSEGVFRPFWFETGTPEFLIKILLERNFFIPQMEEYIVTEDLLGSFDVDFIEPENLLFQTGYLTISKCEGSPAGMIYYLTYPNKEVKTSLNRHILRHLVGSTKPLTITPTLYRSLKEGDLDLLEKLLRSLFAGIPYEWHRKVELSRYEGYYASVVYSFFAGAGLNLIPEDITNEGKIDLTVLFEGKAYVIEFKVVEGDEERGKALKQVREKNYHEKYVGKTEEIYIVGIEFGRNERQIVNFEWERMK